VLCFAIFYTFSTITQQYRTIRLRGKGQPGLFPQRTDDTAETIAGLKKWLDEEATRFAPYRLDLQED